MLPTRRTVACSPFLGSLDRELGRWLNESSDARTAVYPVDISEDDQSYTIEAELPGFTREQVKIHLENNVLSIEAERTTEQPDDKRQVHVNERRHARVSRRFRVPQSVDENNVDARLADGVLHLTLHKKEEVRPRTIEVK